MTRKIHIFGGGTVQFVRNHLALCAPAYGTTARRLAAALHAQGLADAVELHLTKMADFRSEMETNADVQGRLADVLAAPETRVVVFNVALCDYTGSIGQVPPGKYAPRLHSREGTLDMQLQPAFKLLSTVKHQRPDVFLVGFKTTAGSSIEEQAQLARRQIAETAVDLVWANDTVTRTNFLVRADAPLSQPVPAPRDTLGATLVDILKELA